MFTGLIAATGTMLNCNAGNGTARFSVSVPEKIAKQLSEGGSITVNGVCLTALEISSGQFSADLAAETLARTTLGKLSPGAIVNLELPTAAGTPLGGHIVQGHVDGVGQILSLEPVRHGLTENSDWELRVLVPHALASALLPQGSITLDGISLTIAELKDRGDGVEVRIAVIPHTYKVTNLRTLAAGSNVNIETDVLAKYAKRRAESAPSKISLADLIANGY